VSGTDAAGGIAYQHAQASAAALKLAEDNTLSRIRVEADNDAIDLEIWSRTGDLVQAFQFKCRNETGTWGQPARPVNRDTARFIHRNNVWGGAAGETCSHLLRTHRYQLWRRHLTSTSFRHHDAMMWTANAPGLWSDGPYEKPTTLKRGRPSRSRLNYV